MLSDEKSDIREEYNDLKELFERYESRDQEVRNQLHELKKKINRR